MAFETPTTGAGLMFYLILRLLKLISSRLKLENAKYDSAILTLVFVFVFVSIMGTLLMIRFSTLGGFPLQEYVSLERMTEMTENAIKILLEYIQSLSSGLL